jgi:hypothetical protein
MKNVQTLIRHQDIQKWVSSRRGLPAIAPSRDDIGQMKPRLGLSFEMPHEAPVDNPSMDDGLSPVAWSAWLAELDRQHLALRVSDLDTPEFEFVDRGGLN